MSGFEKRLRNDLSRLDNLGLRRTLPGPVSKMGRTCEWDGEQFINFSSNDYLGLSTSDKIKEETKKVLETYGCGAGGSRLICGDHPLYAELEEKIAKWKNRESSLVFGSGYLTNLGVVRAITTGRDLVVHDELAHRCLIEGARLSEADVKSFQHNNPDSLRGVLSEHSNNYDATIVLVEGIYSMDGDRLALKKIQDICQDDDRWLLVDEAHSAGVIGDDGAGLTPQTSSSVEIAMGTLSKAFGGYGGYVAGSQSLKNFLINRATTFIYSTGLPPSVIGSNLAALREIKNGRGARHRDQLFNRVSQLIDGLKQRNIAYPKPPSQIIPIITGGIEKTLQAGEIFREEGIYAVPIRYPTVPRNLGRVRLSLRSDHTTGDIDKVLGVVDQLDNKGLINRTNPWMNSG